MSLRSVIKPIVLANRVRAFHSNCFYLDSQLNAEWISVDDVSKTKVKWSTYVKWKDLNMDVLIATELEPSNEYVSPHVTTVPITHLKSLLQKSIRRSLLCKSLKTSAEFFEFNQVEFLRRLCIIAVEDSQPLFGFSTLVWLMTAASNGFKLKNKLIYGWLLGYVHDLCKHEHYEQFDPKLPEKENKTTTKSIKLSSLEGAGRNLAYSLMFRKAFGGMVSDMNMLQSAAIVWSARYRTNATRWISSLERHNHRFITPPTEPLRASDWLLAAVDFHCNSYLLDELWCKHDQYERDDLKAAIWHVSSSKTNKTLLTGTDYHQRCAKDVTYRATWNAIQKDFNISAKNTVRKLF